MNKPQQRPRKGRLTPIPHMPDGHKPPALDFMHLSADAITLLRYVKNIERELLDAAPDTQVLREIEDSLAKCGDAMSKIMTARQNALSRYTPHGAPKRVPTH